LLELRWKWQDKTESSGSQDRVRCTENCAIDLWFELSRKKYVDPLQYNWFRQAFIDFFMRLYGEGQRLVEVK
jgi:hypothetical protein